MHLKELIMVYKKYIKKNGQTYGPYYYESFRKDGKVINRYVKSSENPVVSNSNFTLFSKRNFLVFGLVILMAFILLLISNNLQTTGKVSLDITTNYVEGENLQGHINFGLAAGELIPTNSRVILQLGDVSKEFLLSDIVSGDIDSGNFFASGASLSGSGEGYGVLGSKTTYPDVDFELKISSSSFDNNGDDIGSETPTEIPAETPADSETAPTEPSSEETLTEESTST
ncbi:MAG TPA: hypothetical protein VI544_02550, partial [Candidatus Nanoarchaeia archaeon]|nr:hypothetical protein [Candidatus Nanoarchaeia archaeon]